MAPLFAVIRRCTPCCDDHDCNCDQVLVDVDVDELLADELATFQATGSAEQRAEIADWLGMMPGISRTIPDPAVCRSFPVRATPSRLG